MNGFDIDSLANDMTPVRRMAPRDGIALTLAATALVTMGVALLFGLRPDLLILRPLDIVMLRAGALLLLGLAALASVAGSARPSIGDTRGGWRWALAAALLFPVSSALQILQGDPFPVSVLTMQSMRYCLSISITGGLLVGGALTMWLRRGAVTDLHRAGWLTGLAAGALGTFAYSLHCPSTSIHYIALWYSLAVAMCAIAGRLIVPRLLRW